MRWTTRMVALTVSLASLGAAPAAGQVDRALIGGAVGVAGGAVITLSTIVARAHLQREYLFEMRDLIHWQSIPMIAAPAAGVAFGWAGSEPMKASIVGSTTGLLVGAGVGTVVGWIVSAQPEGPWAGAVVGAGVGLTVGGLVGGISAWNREPGDDAPATTLMEIRLPLPGASP